MNILSPKNTHLIRLDGRLGYAQIRIETADDVELMGRLKNSKGREIEGGDRVYFDGRKGFWRCDFAPNRVEIFDADIMAKRKSDKGSYYSAVLFKIDVERMIKPPVSFPKMWQRFYDFQMKIIFPQDTHLIRVNREKEYAFIKIKAAADVELIGTLENAQGGQVFGGRRVFYDEETGFWRCYFAPNGDGTFRDIILAKRRNDDGLYHTAVSFKIEARDMPDPPMSYAETWQLFHDLQLKISVPRRSAYVRWSDDASFAECRVRASDDVQLTGRLEYEGSEQANATLAQFDHQVKQWQLLFAPQRTGEHSLWIFARRPSDGQTKKSPSVARLSLNVTKMKRPIMFPIVFDEFHVRKCQIVEPLSGVLKRNSTVRFHCVIPDAKDVRVMVDSQWIDEVDYENSVLHTEILVGSQDVTVYARYRKGNSYEGLVQYTVK